MNNKLIQSYIDNQLSEAERTQFEQQLADSPALQREVEAFKSFKAALRSAALAETTPNLQPMLAQIARPSHTSWLTRFSPAFVAGIAVLGIGFAINRATQDHFNPTVANAKALPPEAHLETKSARVMQWNGSNPQEGARQIREKFYKPIPTIDLNNLRDAKFTATECGSCWISFHYTYKSQNYSIYGRCETGNLDTGIKKTVSGRQAYIFSDAVGWYDKGDMTYTCMGGTPEGRITVAAEAMKTTSKLD